MKQYKITIEEHEKYWEFEGPKGPFVIAKDLLPLHAQHLTNLLHHCGFVVEWKEK